MAVDLNHILFGWYPYLCLTVFLVEQNAYHALKLAHRG